MVDTTAEYASIAPASNSDISDVAIAMTASQKAAHNPTAVGVGLLRTSDVSSLDPAGVRRWGRSQQTTRVSSDDRHDQIMLTEAS
jgi:hypothetical protein